jgi:hypothetical protein
MQFFVTKQTFQVGSRQVHDPYMLQFHANVKPVTNANWLASGIINRAMEILKQQNPGISGLYFSTLGGKPGISLSNMKTIASNCSQREKSLVVVSERIHLVRSLTFVR